MAETARATRILFVTIGQSPRQDLLAELTEGLALPAEISEIGLLDGLSGSEIEELRARPDQTAVVARLANGAWVSLERKKISKLAHDKIAGAGEGEFDLIVLMSTGIFRDLESNCPTVNAQRAVDAAVISVAALGDRVGMIQPLESQTSEFDIPSLALFETIFRHAAHGNAEQLQKAAVSLSDCSYIVLNSVGYSEFDRQVVANATGKPVILPRRIIANSIRLILSSLVTAPVADLSGGLREKLDGLTNRERQVMSLVCEGLPNKAIARQLGISHKTVEIHRSNVLRKMGVPSSGALIRQMVRAGFA
ncbi:MAG: LuxR family transcriptional regulator [Rhodobacteraceae bacterium]|nr:LuxR family transcriptional regulator [Paracoccaceae bacterium]